MVEEENGKKLRGIIYNAPLALTVIEDKGSIDYINSFLPYSIGIEFDTQPSENYDIENFRKIPDIMSIQNDSLEQRYRIPNGVAGMICLYNLLEQMKVNNIYDEIGGIHIHVDMTNTFEALNTNKIKELEDYILTELDKWKYGGTYNRREVNLNSRSGWINFQSGFKTMEIRICNMTFDYTILIAKIIHACEIVTHINDHIKPYHRNLITYRKLNYQEITDYIRSVSKDLKEKIQKIDSELAKFSNEEDKSEIRKKLKKQLISIVKSRIVNMYE